MEFVVIVLCVSELKWRFAWRGLVWRCADTEGKYALNIIKKDEHFGKTAPGL